MRITMDKKTLEVKKIEEDKSEEINVMPELGRILARAFLKDFEKENERDNQAV